MFSAQQTRSGIPTEQQSVLPTVRGVPWWGAVLIALVPTVAGAIIDASNTDGLSTTYRILYFIGCVVAVLAVRRRSLFTAISQPPLIAFGVALITLYLLKADSGSGLRQLILNVMLPIAKTFPLMAWTFIAVAVLGVGRALLTRGRTESTPRRSARHHATKATTRTRTRTTAAKGDDAATDAGARTTRRTAARGSAPRSDDAERSRARRIADEPTRVTNRRPGAERASRSDRTPTERGRSTPAPLTGHRRTDVAPTPASRWDAPAPRRSAAEDAAARRRDDEAARRRDDEAARRRPPPRGERDLAVPRSEREVPPRSDGTGRRRPPPSREEAPRPGDLPPIPRARYRGVNP